MKCSRRKERCATGEVFSLSDLSWRMAEQRHILIASLGWVIDRVSGEKAIFAVHDTADYSPAAYCSLKNSSFAVKIMTSRLSFSFFFFSFAFRYYATSSSRLSLSIHGARLTGEISYMRACRIFLLSQAIGALYLDLLHLISQARRGEREKGKRAPCFYIQALAFFFQVRVSLVLLLWFFHGALMKKRRGRCYLFEFIFSGCLIKKKKVVEFPWLLLCVRRKSYIQPIKSTISMKMLYGLEFSKLN